MDSQMTGYVRVHPPLNLGLESRQVGSFIFTTEGDTRVKAEPKGSYPNVAEFKEALEQDMEKLAWDVLWEKQVAVEFEIAEVLEDTPLADGKKMLTMNFEDIMSSGPSTGRMAGVKAFEGFDLLPRIRDYIVHTHLASGDNLRGQALTMDAALLLAVEHFVKGVVMTGHSMHEFYQVAETVWEVLGGEHEIRKSLNITKNDLDLITKTANQPEFDQRHAPKDAAKVVQLPTGAVQDAARVAHDIITKYSATLT